MCIPTVLHLCFQFYQATPAKKAPAKSRPKPVPKKRGRKPKQREEGVRTSGRGTTVLTEKTLPLGQKLTVIKGDIVDVNAQAYVHPTNSSLSLSGQVGELNP